VANWSGVGVVFRRARSRSIAATSPSTAARSSEDGCDSLIQREVPVFDEIATNPPEVNRGEEIFQVNIGDEPSPTVSIRVGDLNPVPERRNSCLDIRVPGFADIDLVPTIQGIRVTVSSERWSSSWICAPSGGNGSGTRTLLK